MKRQVSLTLYTVVLAITIGIFSLALLTTNYINEIKTDELKAAEDKISVDILSFETQFDLLKESSCTTYNKTALRNELDAVNSKLIYMEQQVGVDNPEVFKLKRFYSVLEIKNYILNKKMDEQCKTKSIFILYFYSNKNCSECTIQEYILRAVRNEYPDIEIYKFDYDLDLPVIKTLISLHNIPQTPPIIDINGKLYAPFDDFDSIKSVLEPLLEVASSTANSKIATSTKTNKVK